VMHAPPPEMLDQVHLLCLPSSKMTHASRVIRWRRVFRLSPRIASPSPHSAGAPPFSQSVKTQGPESTLMLASCDYEFINRYLTSAVGG
jgi:hypothetical protein